MPTEYVLKVLTIFKYLLTIFLMPTEKLNLYFPFWASPINILQEFVYYISTHNPKAENYK